MIGRPILAECSIISALVRLVQRWKLTASQEIIRFVNRHISKISSFIYFETVTRATHGKKKNPGKRIATIS